MNEYHESNLEELLQSQGLFRKIKKKEELRRQYRPTFNKAEALTGMRDTESGGNAGTAYGTGNVAR
ncbi:MAG: hypothetical protein HC888_18605 [Candidatus Competibacteraceae bacterium]|nr:hypothetical protein [Candidatus Competibacteraceae bacterium]